MPNHLYLHIPFCHRICPYCSFYKHQHGNTNLADFVEAMLMEVGQAALHQPLRPRTIYFGGGTPTALSESHLERLLSGLKERLDLSDLVEFSMEANPRTVTASKAAMMRSMGINRVSLGIQAWDEQTLKTLGRDHAPTDAEETFHALREAGFPSLNIDLMFSIPGQTAAAWEATLEHTLRLRPDHISAYNLNYEEDTEFFRRLKRGQFREDEQRDAEFFYRAIDLLEPAGFEHYEISNYARPGHRSLHNESYWMGADYLGFGPGAFSTIDGRRWQNVPDTDQYMQRVREGASAALTPELLTLEQRRTERFGLELRTTRGLPLDLVLPAGQRMVDVLQHEGLLEIEADQVRLTRAGKPLVDAIAVALMAED